MIDDSGDNSVFVPNNSFDDGESFLTSDNTSGSGNNFGHSSLSGGGSSEDNSVITARGTGDGLVLRLDGRIQLHALKAALLSYVETRQGFLVGQEVIFEWLGARPEEGVVAELTQILSSRFGVLVKASRMAERQSSKHESNTATSARGDTLPSFVDRASSMERTSSMDRSATTDKSMSSLTQKELTSQKGLAAQVEGRNTSGNNSTFLEDCFGNDEDNFSEKRSDGYKPKLSPVDGERFDRVSRVSLSTGGGGSGAGTSLFDGLASTGLPVTGLAGEGRMSESRSPGALSAAGVINESLLWDDPDARIIRQTLRSGQKIESEFSVIINGDVNSGAEVVAGGDVIVLGKLRGVVHAGAFEESGRGRFIFAVQMQPTQLRIGSVISRGTKEDSTGGPEIARVEGTMISVESFLKTGTGSATASKKRW